MVGRVLYPSGRVSTNQKLVCGQSFLFFARIYIPDWIDWIAHCLMCQLKIWVKNLKHAFELSGWPIRRQQLRQRWCKKPELKSCNFRRGTKMVRQENIWYLNFVQIKISLPTTGKCSQTSNHSVALRSKDHKSFLAPQNVFGSKI